MSARPLRTPPPAWFAWALLAAWIAGCHLLGAHQLETNPVQYSWFAFLIWIAEAIWTGLEAAGHITLAIVAYSVQLLWAFARRVFNLAVDLGTLTARGFKDAWGFVQKLYDDILKPAWRKFWTLIDRVRGALDKALSPVLAFIRQVRTELLALYTKWIRPVLDTIDIMRKTLKVLETLHVPFAAKLDQQLARFEGLIDRAFQKALSEINKVGNLLNRIATGDGLFQRLALIRSIERDIAYVHREFLNAWHHPLTGDQRHVAAAAANAKPTDDVTRDTRDYLTTRSGAVAAIIDEQIAQGRIYFRAR